MNLDSMVLIQENSVPKIKDDAYVINLDEYESIGTHQIALYMNDNNRRASDNAIYFNNFGVEHILKEKKNSQKTKIY